MNIYKRPIISKLSIRRVIYHKNKVVGKDIIDENETTYRSCKRERIDKDTLDRK